MSSRLPIAFVAALALAGACRDKPRSTAADSSLATDLALAQSAAPTQTVFNDAPVSATQKQPLPEPKTNRPPAPRPSPRREAPPAPVPVARSPRQAPPERVATAPSPTPAPVASAPANAAGVIGAGSRIGMTTNGKVCANSLLVGDKVSATVSSGVTGSNGASIPPGATVVLEVASIDKADPIEQSRIAFRVRSVDVNGEARPTSGDVSSSGTLQRIGESGTSDRNKVIGGAVAGAVLGKIFGHSTKATVIGGAAGAAAGAAAASRSGAADACLPAGSSLSLTINRDIIATRSTI